MSVAGCTIRAVTVAALLLMQGTSMADDELDRSFDQSSIVIEAGNSACYAFDVWLALTPEQQRRGLMHVRQLPRFAGMLFVYPEEDRLAMWMKNTFIPLDILFLRRDGTVSSVAEMTEPLSLTTIPSREPVKYVLELNGGITSELGIGESSRVHLPEL